jgi:hypothetical protein
MKILYFFYFCGSFLPFGIRIRISNLNADPDPDPATQMNADPCGSGSRYGSATLEKMLDPDPHYIIADPQPSQKDAHSQSSVGDP